MQLWYVRGEADSQLWCKNWASKSIWISSDMKERGGGLEYWSSYCYSQLRGYVECVFHPKINNAWVFSWWSLQHYSCLLVIQWLDTSDVCLISCGFMVCDKSAFHLRVMCEVVSCGATDLFVFDMLRCWEDVGVRGAFEDPVQRFQLLLGEGICPKMFP